MRNINLIIFSLIIFSSCECFNNAVLNNPTIIYPQIPVNDSIDINGDYIADFVISYNSIQTLDIPSSGGTISGSITPIENNKVLFHNTLGYLFLDVNDTIRKSFNFNSVWNEYSADLIFINRNFENWEDKWTIQSASSSEYYLGVKLNNSNTVEFGYIRLDFDIVNGNIIVLDTKLTSSNDLIIE